MVQARGRGALFARVHHHRAVAERRVADVSAMHLEDTERDRRRDIESTAARVHDADERAKVKSCRVRIAQARGLARRVEPSARIWTM